MYLGQMQLQLPILFHYIVLRHQISVGCVLDIILKNYTQQTEICPSLNLHIFQICNFNNFRKMLWKLGFTRYYLNRRVVLFLL